MNLTGGEGGASPGPAPNRASGPGFGMKGGETMEIIIKAEAEEIAALVVGLQGRQMAELRDPLSGFNPQGDSLQHHSTSAKDS